MRFLVFVLLISFNAFAISENELRTSLTSEVLSYYLENGTFASLAGEQGARINYAFFPSIDSRLIETTDTALVVVNGRTESYLKYAEFIYDFQNVPADLYLIDHRGQGFSERLLSDRHKGYVNQFGHYVLDLKRLVENVIKPKGYKKIYLLSHSMGGCISALYLELFKNDFDKVVLSSPMLSINTKPYSRGVALTLTEILNLFGKGEDYAPKQSGKEADSWPIFSQNKLTTSETRYWAMQELEKLHPETALRGATVRWIKESLIASKKAVKMAQDVSTPILLFQSGLDEIVTAKGQNEFCAKAKNCRKVEWKNAKHEVLQEQDSIRSSAITQIKTFFGFAE